MRSWIPWGIMALLVAMTTAALVVGVRDAPVASPTYRELLSPFYDPSLVLPKVDLPPSCPRTARSQVQMDTCAASELHELQVALYETLVVQVRYSVPKLALAAESAFESYEKAECSEASAPNAGGSIYPLIYSECEIKLTRQRIQQMRSDLLRLTDGH
jgi:uncharacterized protein YecT (DUF1311 family)